MYNRQLNTFLKVVDCGSFNKAAEQLYVSASAVIQQINHLERDLDVTLLERCRQGIRLTAAGSYLAEEAKTYIQRGEQIKATLRELDTQRPCIYVGTSMEEKCRLLYDLWIMFEPGNRQYDIRMVVTPNENEMPRQAQLVEGVQDGALWQQGWEFLEIFRIPLECAVVKDHPLAAKKALTLQELREHGVLFIDRSRGSASAHLHRWLKEQQIPYESIPEWGGSLIWECSINKKMILLPACFRDIVVDLVMIPCDVPYPVPYGFFYRKNVTEPVLEFLDFVENVYSGTGKSDIVPVL